jgi:hypothetical protein
VNSRLDFGELREQVRRATSAPESHLDRLRAQVVQATAPPPPLAEDLRLIARYTRHWLHYGFLAFVIGTVLVAALEGLLGN